MLVVVEVVVLVVVPMVVAEEEEDCHGHHPKNHYWEVVYLHWDSGRATSPGKRHE